MKVGFAEKTPKLDHMRTFGCAAYAHTKQDKLDPRAILGYPSGVKGYKLWSLEKGDNKVFISRDVLFNESLMPWKESQTSKLKTNQMLKLVGLKLIYWFSRSDW